MNTRDVIWCENEGMNAQIKEFKELDLKQLFVIKHLTFNCLFFSLDAIAVTPVGGSVSDFHRATIVSPITTGIIVPLRSPRWWSEGVS